MNKRRLGGDTVLVILSTGVMLVFFVAPLVILGVYSVFEYDPLQIYVPAFTLENYVELFSNSYNRGVFLRTITLSFAATAIALVIGYAVALYLRRANARERVFITIILMTPILLSDVVLGYAWLTVLAPNSGLVQSIGSAAGLLEGPFEFIGTNGAVLLGLVYFGMGFMVVNLNSALETIGDSMTKAAATLGAGPIRRVFAVVLPLSTPGVLSGVLVTFSMTSSAFVLPQMLGGASAQVLSVFIYDLNSFVLNWPLGAAAAVALLVLSVGTARVLMLLGGRQEAKQRKSESLGDYVEPQSREVTSGAK